MAKAATHGLDPAAASSEHRVPGPHERWDVVVLRLVRSGVHEVHSHFRAGTSEPVEKPAREPAVGRYQVDWGDLDVAVEIGQLEVGAAGQGWHTGPL